MKKIFECTTSIWKYSGKSAWYFINVPEDITKEIDFYHAHEKRGFGSLPVHVTIGDTTWKTSIFPEKKTGTYLLPIKADVRKKEQIKEKDVIQITIEVIH